MKYLIEHEVEGLGTMVGSVEATSFVDAEIKAQYKYGVCEVLGLHIKTINAKTLKIESN